MGTYDPNKARRDRNKRYNRSEKGKLTGKKAQKKYYKKKELIRKSKPKYQIRKKLRYALSKSIFAMGIKKKKKRE